MVLAPDSTWSLRPKQVRFMHNTISIHSTVNGKRIDKTFARLWSKLCFVQPLYCNAALPIPGGRLGFRAPDVRSANGHHAEKEEELRTRLKAVTLFLPFVKRAQKRSKQRPTSSNKWFLCVHGTLSRHISRIKQKPHSRGVYRPNQNNRFKGTRPTWCTELTACKCGGPVFPSTYRRRKHLKVKAQTYH